MHPDEQCAENTPENTQTVMNWFAVKVRQKKNFKICPVI
jgi:hypothetical protein